MASPAGNTAQWAQCISMQHPETFSNYVLLMSYGPGPLHLKRVPCTFGSSEKPELILQGSELVSMFRNGQAL